MGAASGAETNVMELKDAAGSKLTEGKEEAEETTWEMRAVATEATEAVEEGVEGTTSALLELPKLPLMVSLPS